MHTRALSKPRTQFMNNSIFSPWKIGALIQKVVRPFWPSWPFSFQKCPAFLAEDYRILKLQALRYRKPCTTLLVRPPTLTAAPPLPPRGRTCTKNQPSSLARYDVDEPPSLLALVADNVQCHVPLGLELPFLSAHFTAPFSRTSADRFRCIWACRLYCFCRSLSLSRSSRNDGRFRGSLLK